MKKVINIFIVICMVMTYLTNLIAYAEPLYELSLSAKAVAGIGGWTGSTSGDQNKNLGSFRIGGTGSGVVDAYNNPEVGDGKNSADVKVGFARFDLGEDTSAVTKYELKLSNAWVESSRGGKINAYIALVDVDSSVMSGKTPIGETWTDLVWNNRPQLLTELISGQPDAIITPTQDLRIDVTELLKDKTGNVTIAVLGEKAGSDDGDMCYGSVQLIRTSTEYVEQELGINTNFTDSSALADWANASSAELGTATTIGGYAIFNGADASSAPKTPTFESAEQMIIEFDMTIPSKKADGTTSNTLSGGNLSGVAMMNGTAVGGTIGFRGTRDGELQGVVFSGKSYGWSNIGDGNNKYDKWMHYILILDTANDTGDLYVINPDNGTVTENIGVLDSYAAGINSLTNVGIVSASGGSVAIANLNVHAADADSVAIYAEDDMQVQYIPGEDNISTIQYSSEGYYNLCYNKNGVRTSADKSALIRNNNIGYYVSDEDGNTVDENKISISADGLMTIYPTADEGDYTVTAVSGKTTNSLPLRVEGDTIAQRMEIWGAEEILCEKTHTYKALPVADTGTVLPSKPASWSIVGENLGCSIDENGVLSAGSENGKITIKATITEGGTTVEDMLDVYVRNSYTGNVAIDGVLLADGTSELYEGNAVSEVALTSKESYTNATISIKAFSKSNVITAEKIFTVSEIEAMSQGIALDEAMSIGKATHLRVMVFDENSNLISSKTEDLTAGIYKNIPLYADWVYGANSGVKRAVPAGINPELINNDTSEVKYAFSSDYDSRVRDKFVTTNNLLWYKYGAWNRGSTIYDRDGKDWEEQALPIGNGYMGAMLFGMPAKDHIQFNEETFWALGYRGIQEQKDPKYNNDSMGEGINGYMNAGNIFVDFGLEKNETVTDYYRDLNIAESVAHVQYAHNDVTYNREYFASYPKEVIAVRYTADTDGALNFTVNPVSAHPGNMTVKDGEITIIGRLKDSEQWYGEVSHGASDLEYCTKVKVVLNGSDGEIIDHYGNVEVKGATDVIVYIVAATDYDPDQFEFNADGTVNMKATPYKDKRGVAAAVEKAQKRIDGATAISYDELKQEHIADYKSQFDKVHFSLDDDICKIPTNELQLSYRNVINSSNKDITYEQAKYDVLDKRLEALHYNYARYLLLSSSRSTTMPANLQGKWNQSVAEVWGSAYTININLQMNYWFAGGANLLDSGKSLVRWFNSQIPAGRVTAKNMYSVTPKSYKYEDGKIIFSEPEDDSDDVFIMHSKQGINGVTDMTGGMGIQSAGNTAWLMYNLWDLYQTSGDEELLKNELYPIMRKSANFYTQYLYNNLRKTTTDTEKYPDGYYYTTWEGVSPEQPPKSEGVKYDLQLVAGMYDYTIQAAEILGVDEDKVSAWKEIRNHLELPIELGDDGQIKEWANETTYNKDANGNDLGDPQHRHISHLVALYPGTLINRNTPEYLEGAKIVLENRGDDSTGWSCSNKFLLWSRVLDGDKALELFRFQLARKTYSNMFDFHEPFQIDGNFGSAAGVMELLMQSHTGETYILPALPEVWDSGRIDGIKAKDGSEISIEWSDNKAVEFTIKPVRDGDIIVGYEKENKAFMMNDRYMEFGEDGLYTIKDAKAGEIYTFTATEEQPEPEIILTKDNVSVSGQQRGTLVVAGYKDGEMVKIEILDGYNSDITGYDYCTEIKAFLWDNIEDIIPLCESETVVQ